MSEPHMSTLFPSNSPFDSEGISVGNANSMDAHCGGWFVGNFLSSNVGLRRAEHIEVKWGVHPAGERRDKIGDRLGVHSLAILISGRFSLEFPSLDLAVLLREQGDYVLYGPRVPHLWCAVESTTIVTVRWSIPTAGHTPIADRVSTD